MACSVQNPGISVICLRLTMNSLRFSDQSLAVLVDCRFKIEEFPNKMAISSAQNFKDKPLFLKKLTGFVPQFWILDHTFSCFVFSSSLPLMHSSKVPLGSTTPFGRPSASFENSSILSLHLTIPAASLSVLSKTQHQKAFSLNASALLF